MDVKRTGSFIAEMRKGKNMTQAELAAKLQVTDKAVSRWERGVGYPDITLLEPLAGQLGVTVLDILRGEKTFPDNSQAGSRAETPGSPARYPAGHRDADRRCHAHLGYPLVDFPAERPEDHRRGGRALGSLCGLEGGADAAGCCLGGRGCADPCFPAYLQMEEIEHVNRTHGTYPPSHCL